MTDCSLARKIFIFAAVCLLAICPGCCPSYGQDQIPGRRTIVCDEAHGCSHRFINGSKFKIISDKAVVVMASPDTGLLPSKFTSMSVIVYNHTSTPIDVVPSEMLLTIVEPKEKTLRPITPDKVARAVNHGHVYSSIMKLALKSNTVNPGQSVAGSVFFEGDRKAKLVYLLVYMAGTVYEFPFAKDELN